MDGDIGSELLDPKFEPEIQYLRRLSSAKKVANEYFLHGRAMRDIPLQSHLPNESVVSQPWLSRDGSRLLIPITTVKREGKFDIRMKLEIEKYGFEKSNHKFFNVNQIQAYGG